MPSSWSKIVKDYFTFTKKERIGIAVLIGVGSLLFIAPKFFNRKKEAIDKESFAKELADLKITMDSNRQYKNYKNDDDNEFEYYKPKSYDKSYDKNYTAKGNLFEFDPNTLDVKGWQRLGIRDKTIQTIQKFVAKGYKFRQPEDIRKVYGLHEDEANRIIPFIRIAVTNEDHKIAEASYVSNAPMGTSKPAYKPRIVDINLADTAAFIALPGIGSKLAMRIVNFREKLGGFTSVQQLAETYGVPDSTFQKIKPMLQCSPENLKMIDINKAEASDLKNHPYFKWNIANAIVNYRKQHGQYNAVTDLKKIDIITDEVYEKISPYLVAL